jgi:hypothetical protein
MLIISSESLTAKHIDDSATGAYHDGFVFVCIQLLSTAKIMVIVYRLMFCLNPSSRSQERR